VSKRGFGLIKPIAKPLIGSSNPLLDIIILKPLGGIVKCMVAICLVIWQPKSFIRQPKTPVR